MIRISTQPQVAFKATCGDAAIFSADVVKRRLKAVSCAGYFQLGKVRSHCRPTRRELQPTMIIKRNAAASVRRALLFSLLFAAIIDTPRSHAENFTVIYKASALSTATRAQEINLGADPRAPVSLRITRRQMSRSAAVSNRTGLIAKMKRFCEIAAE